MRANAKMALAILFAMALAACANAEPADEADDEQTGAATEAEPTATEEAAADGPYEHLAQAEAGEFEGTEVSILGQWIEAEGENFEATLADFAERTGIEITYDGVSDYTTVLSVRVEGGDPPDLAQVAQPGLMREFVADDALVDLGSFMNVEQLQSDYAEAWLDLNTVDDGTYGVYYKADGKSIVWYPVAAFEEAGYEIPQTWDDLMALSQQIVDDGNGAPWCISQEQGDATGWVATDWIEDVLLRTAPPEVYDQWVAHEIPFDDAQIVEAAELVGELWFADDFAFGGATYINATWVGDTQTPMFDEAGPQCWLHKQAAWIPDFWPTDPETEEPLFTPGEDSAFFAFPPIEEEFGNPVLGSGDMIVMFDDRPEVRAVIEYLATAEAAQGWIQAGGFVSPNRSVPTDWYQAYTQREMAGLLNEASTVRFDASDQMPAEVGQGTFWSGMIEWVAAGGANTEEVLAGIEASWPS